MTITNYCPNPSIDAIVGRGVTNTETGERLTVVSARLTGRTKQRMRPHYQTIETLHEIEMIAK